MTLSFILFQFLKFLMLFAIAVGTGLLAEGKLLKVNYTRKINHFAITFLPDLLYHYVNYQTSHLTVIAGALISLGYFIFFIKPLRSRIRPFEIAFHAIDRPEDRPHTLCWFVTQFAAGIAVIIPFYLYFATYYDFRLIIIPILINGLGDGLAEPVGVRFGRHPYPVRPLFGKNQYIRTLEGSACVFLSAIVILFYFQSLFTPVQFITALLIVPIVSTLAEALSPHTWDAPFILLTGGAALVGIMKI